MDREQSGPLAKEEWDGYSNSPGLFLKRRAQIGLNEREDSDWFGITYFLELYQEIAGTFDMEIKVANFLFRIKKTDQVGLYTRVVKAFQADRPVASLNFSLTVR